MSYDLMFAEANRLYADGALKQAEDIYRQILQINPHNPDVLNMLGLIAHQKFMFAEAQDFFYQALRISPNHLPLYFNLAVSLQADNKLCEAENAYRQVLRLNPNLKEAWNNLGGVYEALQLPDKARQCYLEALKADADYLEAAVNLAVLDNDTQTLQQLTAKNSENPLPYYYLSLLNFNQKQYDKAQNYIDKALQLCTHAYEIYLLAAQIYLSGGILQKSSQYFEKTLELNPKCVTALINLANLQHDENLYKKAADLAPDNADVHADYAALLYSQGRIVEALEEYRKAVIINPDMPEVSNNLALILKDQGDYEQALDLLLNAIKLNPLQTDFAVNLAETLTLFSTQNPQKALEIAKQWKDFSPDNPVALHILAALSENSSSASLPYSEILFDKFAPSYEATMQKIKYSVIDKLKSLNPDFSGNILDLGCGTGLAAQAFKTPHNRFTGVDISQKMLDIAAQKHLYSQLIKSDITDFLECNKLKFNLIIALDVFEYIENIAKVFNLCHPTKIIFTIENTNEAQTYKLTATGRYQHNPDYVLNLLQKAGYQNITRQQLTMRKENGQDVVGTLFIAN